MPVTLGSALQFVGEQSLDILTLVDPFGIARTAAGFPEFRTPTEQLSADIFGERFQAAQVGGQARMGLASFFGGLARGAAQLFQPAVAAVAPVAGRIAPTIGRVAGRALQGGGGRALLAGTLGAAGGGVAVGVAGLGGEPVAQVNAATQAALAQGLQPITITTGNRVLAMTPDGSTVTIGPNGRIIRPQIIVSAGQRLPDGATVVFISADRTQIGITKKRRRRSFAGEVRRVRRTIQGCTAVLAAAAPRKRRA